MPATTSVSPSGNQDIDGLLYDHKWAVNSFTFSFPTSGSFYESGYGSGEPTNGFDALNATQQNYVRNYVQQQYAWVANVTFTEITETSTQHADLRFAESNAPSTAWAYLPYSGPEGGDSWYRNSGGTYDNTVVGNYAAHTFLHEVGHAFGLLHGHDSTNPYGALPAAHDSLEYSVMTYRTYVGGPLNGYSYGTWSAPQTLMQNDIAAMQYLYGANFNTRSGNTVYTWDPSTGQQFVDGVGQSAPGGNKIFMTVWDSNGTDTYDFSNYTTNLSVNLAPGGWTTVSSTQLASLGSGHFAVGNIANALQYNGDARSLIENAIGGTGNDTIIGNTANNVLDGRQGNDVLTGGPGNDTFVFASGYGSDSVTDFVAGAASGDKIDLAAFAITSLSQALSYASQVGANTVFNFGGSDILTLNNVNLNSLIADDFLFAGPPPPPPSPYAYAGLEGDFDGDGQPDILWRNDSGLVSLWQMNGAQYLVSSISNDWQIAGIGDFNGDNKSDVLWRNSAGAVKLWQMNGTQIQLDASVGSWSNDWHIVGIGDFNGDSKDDILWRNDSGAVTIWQMNGAVIEAATSVGSVSTETRLSGIGDHNGDNKDDILWRDNSGAISFWQMNGTIIQATTSAGSQSNDWHAVGIGDFDGDGVSDILWRNDSGAVTIWEINGTKHPAMWVPPEWDIAGIGDFNVDGKDDILWRHNSGAITMWQMNDTPIPVNALVGAASNDWHIVASGDLKGDSVSDVLWRNDSGAFSIWEMNGAQTLVGSLSNDWQIAGVGNIKGDSKADILWRDTNGTVIVFEANGTQHSIGSNTSDWHIAGVGDFRGDGTGDILWRNDSGALSVWEMNGTQASFGSNTSDWHIEGIGNLSGDSKTDILWRNDNGALSIWVTNSSQISFGSQSSDWHFAGIGDFNGDSVDDILWRNDSGAISWWEVNGTKHAALWVPNYWQLTGIGDYDGDGKSDMLWRHGNGAVTMTNIDGTQTLVGNASTDWHIVTESTGSPTPVGAGPSGMETAWQEEASLGAPGWGGSQLVSHDSPEHQFDHFDFRGGWGGLSDSGTVVSHDYIGAGTSDQLDHHAFELGWDGLRGSGEFVSHDLLGQYHAAPDEFPQWIGAGDNVVDPVSQSALIPRDQFDLLV